MQFPYYGHSSIFYFWFNLFLAVFGLFWAWLLVYQLKNRKLKPVGVMNWILLFWFMFWLPHASYYSLELVKHLTVDSGVLRPINFSWNFAGGVATYLVISIIGAISCVTQISLVLNGWRKYSGGKLFLVFFLVFLSASFGTVIGLCHVNFFNNPLDIFIVIRQIITFQAPYDCFNLGPFWPILIGDSLFFIWMVLFMIFGEYIYSSEKKNK